LDLKKNLHKNSIGAPSLIGAEPWKVEKGNVFSPPMFDVEDCMTKRVFAFGHNLNTKI
jgi:hypothetical protein